MCISISAAATTCHSQRPREREREKEIEKESEKRRKAKSTSLSSLDSVPAPALMYVCISFYILSVHFLFWCWHFYVFQRLACIIWGIWHNYVCDEIYVHIIYLQTPSNTCTSHTGCRHYCTHTHMMARPRLMYTYSRWLVGCPTNGFKLLFNMR